MKEALRKNEAIKTKVGVASLFPDWDYIQPGNWSRHGKIINCASGTRIEIGLYREPAENEEYAGTYTLQIFRNDDVIVCEQITIVEEKT